MVLVNLVDLIVDDAGDTTLVTQVLIPGTGVGAQQRSKRRKTRRRTRSKKEVSNERCT